ncbi:MAG: hypothetical protein JXR63_12725 [Spirochaetales bacterium]|nr:hypothetical protein [Spirochaetales bacterium]
MSFLNSSKKAKEFLEEQLLSEMSNYTGKYTGLPMNICVLPMSGKEKHWARIKVQMNHNYRLDSTSLASVSISKEPEIKVGTLSSKDFKAISKFIIDNYDLLMDVWNQKIEPTDFILNCIKYKEE